MTPEEKEKYKQKAFSIAQSKALPETPFSDAAIVKYYNDTYLKPQFESKYKKSADAVNKEIADKKLVKLNDLIAVGDSVSKANGGAFIKAKDYITDPDEYKQYKEAMDRQNKRTSSDFTGTGIESAKYNYGPRTYTDRAKILENYGVPSMGWNIDVEHKYNPETKRVDSAPIEFNTTDKFDAKAREWEEVPASKLGLPELANGVDTTSKFDASKTSAVASGVGQVGGAMFDTFDQQEHGKTSVGGAALKGAAAGAAAGSVVGPWGTVIGGVVGGAAGAISSTMSNKKIDAKIEEQRLKSAQLEKMSHFQPLKNTQASMYAKGIAMAATDKLAEVEKDEVVLRKDVQGKFVKVADFKGGKSHEQGGEPYVVTQGDVIFPGHKRDLINSYLKNDNHSAIDRERQKLPKEVPSGKKMFAGGDFTKKYDLGVSDNKYDFGKVDVAEEAKKVAALRIGKDAEATPTYLGSTQLSKGGKGLFNSASPASANIAGSANPGNADKPKSDWWSAVDYAQPIGNMVKSLQTPEKTERRFISPEELQYKDQSAGVRQEAAIADKVRRGNTTTSAQQNRANANISSAMKSRDMQNINAQEVGRADQIAAANIDIRNQDKARKLDLANKYDELDMQNKAVLQAYGDRGLSDLASVAAQQRRDKGLEKSQDIMLRSLATDNFEFTGSDGVIYKRAPGGTYINAKTAVPKPSGVSVTPKK